MRIINRLTIFNFGLAVASVYMFTINCVAQEHNNATNLFQTSIQESDSNSDSDKLWLTFQGQGGPGKGKTIVLISGDDEYRSEQTMPMLGKILAVHHGFDCHVLFAIEPETGTVKPDYQTNIPGMELLDQADLIILGLRFRNLPDKEMKHFVDYVESGKPIIGTRTSTHAFNYPKDSESQYKHYGFNSTSWEGGFGQQVLGDTWISHHGKHRKESCRGVIENGKQDHPILKGVTDVWGPSDVYGIRNLPESANILMRGAVLEGMAPDDQPVKGKKNDPMMPIAWTKSYDSKAGVKSKIFCTTMGASTDFESAGLRRLVVNAAYWCLGLEDKIPAKSNVDYVDEYRPTEFGFGTFQKGLTPSDYDMKSK
ncbi:MAG: ThuA domain-containing protein [Planctomycetota bacterium]